MMAEAARSNWMVSCRLGHVDVVVGITVAGNGVHGVLELLLLLLCSDMFDTWATPRDDGGLGYRVSWDVNPESWLETDMYRIVPLRPTFCESDRCQWGWLGEWWLFELPDEELFSELIEHIDDFLEPRLEGDDGGVRNDQPPSELFKSAITCSDAGGRVCGSAVCFSSCWTASCRCDISVNIATSSSCNS
jgi:hypothetical protein